MRGAGPSETDLAVSACEDVSEDSTAFSTQVSPNPTLCVLFSDSSSEEQGGLFS